MTPSRGMEIQNDFKQNDCVEREGDTKIIKTE